MCFFFKDTATTEIYTYCHTLSLHDALPISFPGRVADGHAERAEMLEECTQHVRTSARKQPDRCRVPAVIVRDDQVDRVDIVELVYLVLAVDYGYVPS